MNKNMKKEGKKQNILRGTITHVGITIINSHITHSSSLFVFFLFRFPSLHAPSQRRLFKRNFLSRRYIPHRINPLSPSLPAASLTALKTNFAEPQSISPAVGYANSFFVR